MSLNSRIHDNHICDQTTLIVTKVEKLESLPLRKKWMIDLAQAIAFLESLNLAHGDLRPENILLDRDRLKVADFNYTAEIGTEFKACMAPYGRRLNGGEPDQGRCGSPGFLGPRTEQFALGSIFYLINYGFEVYGDRSLAENPKEHERKVADLLQHMEFPKLNGEPLIDFIIDGCWHNKYATVTDLAAFTETLLPARDIANDGEPDDYSSDTGQKCSAEDFASKKAFCQDLEKRGLLELLNLGEPEHLGFTAEWYRYSKK